MKNKLPLFFKILPPLLFLILLTFNSGFVNAADWTTTQDISDKHITFSYTWYLRNEDNSLPDTLIMLGEITDIETGGNLEIIGEDYLLTTLTPATFMKTEENSEDFSDYYITVNLFGEYENLYGGHTISYGDGLPGTKTFGYHQIFTENRDYRNITINFCDPDTQSGCTSNCKLGYNLSEEEMSWSSRAWDSTTEECCGDDYNRSEKIFPDFLYGHVDEPDFSEAFCETCPLGNDLDNKNDRTWDDNARCCGDDDGNWYPELNVEGTGPLTDVDGLNNYNDCAKLVNNGEYLCNYHRAPSNKSRWDNAKENIGEIIYIPCASENGFEAVSDGYKWIGCWDTPTSTSPPHNYQFTGEFFLGEKRIDLGEEEEGWKHSYFCISPPKENGKNTIYECC